MSKEKLPTKYHIFYLSTGYVESASLGEIQFWSGKGFDTVLEGLYDLGLSIQKSLEKLDEYQNRELAERLARGSLPECCLATLAADANRHRCARCWRPIRETKRVITAQDVNDEINAMMRQSNDEYGYDLTQDLGAFFNWFRQDPFAGQDRFKKSDPKHYRVFVESFSWHPQLLSPRHNRRSVMEWTVAECKMLEHGRHPGMDYNATDGIDPDEDEE